MISIAPLRSLVWRGQGKIQGDLLGSNFCNPGKRGLGAGLEQCEWKM